MRTQTLLNGLAGGRSATLILLLLTIAAIGILEALPCTAADVDDTVASAEGSLVLGTTAKPDDAARVRVSDAYGRLPLSFETNRGQTDSEVKFLARGTQHTLFLSSTEAVLVFRKPEEPEAGERRDPKAKLAKPGTATRTVVSVAYLGANPMARVAGLDELPGKINYFIGSDPAKWRVNVPTYAKVQYQDLYPGIDLVYYGNRQQLEYDFVLRPGADPRRITLSFQGADKLEVDTQGDLVLHTAAGTIRHRKPVIYQDVDGLRRDIAGGYVLREARTVGFGVGTYDLSRPLIIDPVLFYSTYLGGSGDDEGLAIAVDTVGNTYVTGRTNSTNFPTTAGAFQTTSGALFNAFVTKLDPTGSALLYSSYLGGSGSDEGRGLAVDTVGNTYVTGRTSSTDFPTTTGAFQAAPGGVGSAFVTKLDSTGSALLYSTYLGGSGIDEGFGIAVDTVGNAYVTGVIGSTDFPTTTGAFQSTLGGFSDAFVAKLNPTAAGPASLVYSTYLGGSGNDEGRGLAVDAGGNAYVTGRTSSTDFPTTTGAFQTTAGGLGDAFVTKLDPTGSALLYSTYLGGSGADESFAIAVDPGGNAYVTGFASSTNFPTTTGAFQSALGGFADAFVTKLNSLGSGLVYSTYLGGSEQDQGRGLAVDPGGNAYVTGFTASTNFPTTTGAFQTAFGGFFDAFVTKLDPLGSALVYSTYLGGSGSDVGFSIAVDAFPNANAYVTGLTDSTNFPTTTGVFQSASGGSSDVFVAKMADVVLPQAPTTGKVNGGGSINVAGGRGTFAFIAQRQETTDPVKGQLQYVNHVSGAKVHSLAITSLVITSNMATLTGTCTVDTAPCTFTVDVTDNGEPGTTDSFVISVVPGSTEGGTIRSGNIKIHDIKTHE